MNKQLKNTIVFILDRSSSMSGLKPELVKVFNRQIEHLKRRSVELKQETRVSVYAFNESCLNIVWDTDVLRTPDIEDFYFPSGSTAVIDSTIKVISDLKQIPEIYTDNSFLIYVLSDGESNSDKNSAATLSGVINQLPENYTLAFLAPSQSGVHEAKMCGFPANNIQVWNVSSAGIAEASEKIIKATETYMAGRAKGVRGSKNLFNINVNKLPQVTKALSVVPKKNYLTIVVNKENDIKSEVEKHTNSTYIRGTAYYQLVKPEKVQNHKKVCVLDRKTDRLYSGQQARDLIGLPDYEVKVDAVKFGDYDVFVESQSLNRKLLPGQRLIVFK